MNISEIRSRFPVLKKYTYLNTARFCALPSQVVETQEQFHKHLVEKGSWHFEDWLDMYEHTRKMVAEMLGTSPGSIFFLPNVSTGINMASLYLERKRIILLQGDFPSVVLPWKSLGFEIVELQYNSPDFYQALHEEIKKGNRNLCLSWIQSFDGFEVDLKQIFEWCKAYKTTLILDGTQGMGAIPVQIDPEVSMVFLATGFKWLLAGYGIAIGYVSDDLINRFKAFTGWNSIDYGTGDLKAGAASLEVGNALFHGVLGLYEGLKILKEVGIENVMIRNLQLRDYLTQNLDQVEFFKDSRSSIVRVIHSDYDKLVEKSIQVTQQGQYIRVSPNFYNIKEELEVLINP